MEDQEIMEQFIENKQGYVIDNINADAGCGGIGVGEVMSSSEEILGVKYDEQLHEKTDVGDDDELKYVKEVQQSEKQHSMENVGDGRNSNELAEKEKEVDKYEVGIEEENMNNQKDLQNITLSVANDNTNGHDSHNNIGDQMKQVVDVPPTDLAPSGTEYVGYSRADDYQEQYEVEKGDDSSSLTTKTRNDNSFTENLIQPMACVGEIVPPFAAAVEDQSRDLNTDHSIQSNDFDLMPSQLNPEAKEFVPTFESNILSPMSPSDMVMTALKEDELEKAYFGQVPSAVPRHFIAEDDFVAQSPRKGRGDNMDTIFVPAVQEFEEEADQRPHELEANGEIKSIDEKILNADKAYETPLGDLVAIQGSQLENVTGLIGSIAPTLIDHGPETFVDNDDDINIGETTCKAVSEENSDLMKQSIYVTNEEAIETVLNSVQPIPTEIDGINNSFIEEVYAAVPIGDKEMLQVEEKEHISKSPSTEEIQMNLHILNKDVAQGVFDMEDASVMQDSFYTHDVVQKSISICSEIEDHSAIIDNSDVLEATDKREETPDREFRKSEKELPHPLETGDIINNLCATHTTSAEEKHLIEETKEDLQKLNIEHLMSEMAINDNGVHLQVDEKETEPNTIDNDKSKNLNSSDIFVDKCEQIMVVAENTTDAENECIHHSPKQEEQAGVANLAYQHTSNSNEDNLVQIEDPLTDNRNESLFIVAADENKTEISKTNNLSEDATPDMDAVVLNPIPVSDLINISKEFELTHQKEIGETDDSETEQVLYVNSCKEQEVISETKVASIEQLSYGNENTGHQNICEKKIARLEVEAQAVPSSETMVNDSQQICELNVAAGLGEETQAEPLSETIVNDNVAETIAVCSTATNKANLPLESSNINAIKKTGIKNTSSSLKAKTTPSLSTSSKKLNTTVSDKKPVGIVAKPKLSAVKPSTLSGTTDRKPNKPMSVGAPTVRKLLVTTTAAPKIPLKANLSSRSAQVTTSITKSTTSRPVAASRTITSAVTTARKPAASVNNTAAKTRPASSSAVPAKTNTLGASGISTIKPKAASPRATLTSQMRKPGSTTTTEKSPIKSTIPHSLTKPTSSSLGTRPKPALSAAGSGGSTAMKTTAARTAPKASSCPTTTSRRLTVGGSSSVTTTTNTATKVTTVRKSSPIKPPPAKTPTKPVTSGINSNTKSAIKATSPKSTENKLNGQSEMNGGIASVKANDMNIIKGSLQDASITGDFQKPFLNNEDLNKPLNNDNNLATSEDFKRGVIDPLQEDLIGAYDH